MGTFCFSRLWQKSRMSPLPFSRAAEAANTGLETQHSGGFVGPVGAAKRGVSAGAPPQGVEFRPALRLVDELGPIFRSRDWRRSDHGLLPFRGRSGQAGPFPVFRTPNQIGSDRVSLDIPHDGQKMRILLNWKCFETTLPDTTGCITKPVMPADMACEQPVHPVTEITVAVWPQNQMKMVRHQTVRQYSHRYSIAGLCHQLNE